MPRPEAAPGAGRLRAALRALAHRGPDGEGTWLSPGGRAAPGHRRFAAVHGDAPARFPRAESPA